MKFFIQWGFLKMKDKTYEETLKMFAYSLAFENDLDLAIQIVEGYLTIKELETYIKSYKNKNESYYFMALSKFRNLIMEE